MRLPQAGDAFVHVPDGTFTLADDGDGDNAMEHGDIKTRGWLTTEKLNSYRQIVHSSTFDWEGGFKRWQGRILSEHGRRFLIGGGDGTPIGKITTHQIVKGAGLYGIGHIYHDNPPLLKRALLDGTLNAWSIGFTVMEDGFKYDKKKDILNITKGQMREVSLVYLGANDESFVEIIHSLRTYRRLNPDNYCYIIKGGVTYLVNLEGEVHNAS